MSPHTNGAATGRRKSCLSPATLIGFKIAVIPDLIDGPVLGLEVLLPLGISYYSFKTIHFIIEYRRGRITDYSAPHFFSYMFLFTAFTAGPIQRYDRFIEDSHTEFSWTHFEVGLTRLAYGMIKQFVIVGYVIGGISRVFDLNYFGGDLMWVFREVSTPQLWGICAVAYLSLYLQFSAYTDIAIGLSRLFGIVIMENFNFPFLATSIVDFWQRWHMTLTNWCRHYIFMPLLGLTRLPIVAAYGTFFIIGLWHAFSIDRLMWGVMHGTAVILYVTISRRFGRATLIRPGLLPKWMIAAGGFAVTQSFLVFSMSLLIVEENHFGAVFRIWGRLFGIG